MCFQADGNVDESCEIQFSRFIEPSVTHIGSSDSKGKYTPRIKSLLLQPKKDFQPIKLEKFDGIDFFSSYKKRSGMKIIELISTSVFSKTSKNT